MASGAQGLEIAAMKTRLARVPPPEGSRPKGPWCGGQSARTDATACPYTSVAYTLT
jgi:hypothetical protein